MKNHKCWPLILLAALMLLSTGCRTSKGGGGPGSVRAVDGRTVPDEIKWKVLGDAQRVRRDIFSRAGLPAEWADKYSPTIEFIGMDYNTNHGPVKKTKVSGDIHGSNNIGPGQKRGYIIQLADDNFNYKEWVLAHEEGHSLAQGELRYQTGAHGYTFGPPESAGHPKYIQTPDGKKHDMGYVINGRWPSRVIDWTKVTNLNPLNIGKEDTDGIIDVTHYATIEVEAESE